MARDADSVNKAVSRRLGRYATRLALVAVLVGLPAVLGYRYVTAMPEPGVDYGKVADAELGGFDGPNAAPLYAAALDAMVSPNTMDPDERTGASLAIPLLFPGPPSDHVSAWVELNHDALGLSRKALRVDRCWFPVRIADGQAVVQYHRSHLRSLVDGWGHRAWLAAQGRDVPEARRCYGRALRIVRHLYQVPSCGHDLEAAARAEIRTHKRWAGICEQYRGALTLPPVEELKQLAKWPNFAAGMRVRELVAADGMQYVYSPGGHWVSVVSRERTLELLYNLRGLLRPSRSRLEARIQSRYGEILSLLDGPAGAERNNRIAAVVALLAGESAIDRGLSLCDAGREVFSVEALRELARAQGLRVGIVRLYALADRQTRERRLPRKLDRLPSVDAYVNAKAGAAGIGYRRVKDTVGVYEHDFMLYTFGLDGRDGGGPAPPVDAIGGQFGGVGRWGGDPAPRVSGPISDDDPVWPPLRDAWPMPTPTPAPGRPPGGVGLR